MPTKLLLALSLFCLPPAFAAAQESDDEIFREALWTRASTAKPPARPLVGLALSGGGARGFAHTGVLEALEYAGFPVDYVAGTSMGALIGAIYSSGQSIEELWGFGRDAARLKVGRDFGGIKMLPLLIADKLITPKHITRFIESRLSGLTFEKLRKPFACTAMDIRTGEKVLFTEGPLDIAVRASVNLPGVFAPVQYRHRYLVDGGVVDNVPVHAARGMGADWVLASVMENSVNKNPESVLTTLLQVIDIRGSLLAKESERAANFVMRSQVGDMGVADFERCTEAGEAGLTAASSEMAAARENYLIYAAPLLVEKL
ncbi:MAG: patatin-like phospholipase family protein [Elusimicrobiales bacterium]|nr:patatin-like phospholipase family protein [Elusimicrobiales bacterium]